MALRAFGRSRVITATPFGKMLPFTNSSAPAPVAVVDMMAKVRVSLGKNDVTDDLMTICIAFLQCVRSRRVKEIFIFCLLFYCFNILKTNTVVYSGSVPIFRYFCYHHEP